MTSCQLCEEPWQLRLLRGAVCSRCYVANFDVWIGVEKSRGFWRRFFWTREAALRNYDRAKR